jgi:hypothetical protein
MNRKTALIELRDKVQAGDAAEVCGCLGMMVVKDTPWDFASQVISAHRGSLDAAKALHEAVLPGFEANINAVPRDDGFVAVWIEENASKKKNARVFGFSEYGINPARAWLIAIIDALIAMEK